MWLYTILMWLLERVQMGNVLIIPIDVSFGVPSQDVSIGYSVPFKCAVDWRAMSEEQQDAIRSHAKSLVANLGVTLTPESTAMMRIDHVQVVP